MDKLNFTQYFVFTKPFKTGMSVDLARGRDSWCWPKGARPLRTRMFLHWCYAWTVLLSANQNREIFYVLFVQKHYGIYVAAIDIILNANCQWPLEERGQFIVKTASQIVVQRWFLHCLRSSTQSLIRFRNNWPSLEDSFVLIAFPFISIGDSAYLSSRLI